MRRAFQIMMTAALLGCAGWAFGQATNSGDITGTVTDTTGAVLPDVTVTVLDVDKNDSHTSVTNQAGVYDTGSIVPDHYILTFTKEGFTTYKRGPITVYVGVMGLNVSMGVGQATQQVVVTTDVPLLNTTSAEISSTIASQTLVDLPQVGTPDWQSWIGLQPGISAPAGSTLSTPLNPGMQGAANGSMPYITTLMDGAQVTSVMSDNVIYTPIFDSISEVQIIDGLFSAQYGLGGVIYSQITKGGTSQYHGMAYDYFQNSALDAAPYSFGKIGVVPLLRYNDIGGNVGGPVPLPHLRKRMFFFIDHEYTINHAGPSSSTITSVPTTAMESGDFTGFKTIYDPTTQTVNPTTGAVTRQSFASEYGNGNKIPASMISSVAKALQAYFPAPTPGYGTTVNGVPTNNLFYNIPVAHPFTKWFGRFDADITPKNRLTGSAAWNHSLALPDTSPFYPWNSNTTNVENSNNQLTDVWTISNSFINEFRMGYMEEYDLWVDMTAGLGIPAKAGLQFAKTDNAPILSVTGENVLEGARNGHYISSVLDPSDTLTWVKGRHDLHFGLEYLILRADSELAYTQTSANLAFTGVYTASTQGTASTTGTPYADFLLGYANSWAANITPEYGARLKDPQLFVQDDWKVTPKLTLNLGLRWAGTTGFSEVHKNELSFDPTVTNPATNTLGAMWNAVTHANGRTTVQKPQWNGWLPRIGVNYALGQKTTIRGGYGIFTFPWSCNDYCATVTLAGAGLMGALFSTSGTEADSTNGAEPVVTLSDSGNTNFQGAKGASINSLFKAPSNAPDAYNGQQVQYAQYDTPLTRLQGWSLTVQRQFGQSTMAQVGYIGSRGGNLIFFHDLNQIPQSKLSASDSGSRPYPNFQSIIGIDGIGTSNYNSLQAIISQHMSAGLQFSFNYTWSKMLSEEDSSGWYPAGSAQLFQNSYVPSANYGLSNYDTPQMFKGEAVYQLPFGKGRRFLNNNAALNEAIGGWQLSGDLSMMSGTPLTPVMSTDQSYGLSAKESQFPNVIGDPKAAGSSGTVHEWFNVAAFTSPGAGEFGDTQRDRVRGPGTHVVNAALRKTFPIRERLNFEFYAEATNVVNHPSFALPDSLIGPGHTAQITGVLVGGRQMMLVGKLVF